MKFQISARKFRPQRFEEVVGQKHLVQILTNSIREEKIAQAYLFSGMRGVGKTTIARIFAKALNCAEEEKEQRPCNRCLSCQEITQDRSLDVMQIDGASNTSVDDVRELRETLKYLPLRGRYKIYIIDEVHMLSNAAFNALLKTLEEPPSHLVFILATTELHKIPATVLSRCQHLAFRRIGRREIETHLKKVVAEQGGQMADSPLAFIAKASEGSLRDGLSLLDQAIAYGGLNITEETLSTLLGRVAQTAFHTLVRAMGEKDAPALLKTAREIENGGYDLRQFLSDWIEHLWHILVCKHVKNAEGLIGLPEEEQKEIEREGSFFSTEALHRIFALFVKLQEEIRNAPRPHLLFEAALMKAILLSDLTPIEKIIEQMEGLSTSTRSLAQRSGVSEPAPEPSLRPQAKPPLSELFSSSEAPPVPLSQLLQSEARLRKAPPQEAQPQEAPPQEPPLQERANQEQFQLWGQFLREVKGKRPSLASCLDQGKVLDIQEKTIQILFSGETAFLVSLIQKEENLKWLHSLLKNYFKRALKLVFVPLSSGGAGLGKESTDPKRDPLVQEVLTVFEGAVIKSVGGKDVE